jgi:Flp pilus assembly protein TadG/V8-like Glu-specific endopeptidase
VTRLRHRLTRPFRARLARLASARSQEGGYITILLAVLLSSGFLFAAMAISIDTSRWYDEMNRVQKAADAAALAGVPFLPFDLTNATIRAKEVAARNGYDDAAANVVVTVEIGDLASQLKVTISSQIKNSFGGFIGAPTTTLTRTATADYKGPAPMGSPCNTFGNEPNAGSGSSSPTPSGTAQGSSPFSNCSRNPTFWGVIEGPETGKLQGDRYSTKGCETTGVDGCTGTTNDEYGPRISVTSTTAFGYVFVVKVLPAAVGTSINLQVYDPIQVGTTTGSLPCGLLPTASSFTNDSANTNPWVINSDARNRYSKDGSTFTSFCTGDSYPGTGSGASPKHAMTTSFVLRQQVDSLDPTAAPVQNDTSGNPCIKQYGSVVNTAALSANLFKSSASGYNADLARMFHNWVPLCTFTPTRAGDYYIQVRTNVSLGGSGAPGLERTGNTAAAALTGDTTTGEGSNAFALRAVTQAGREKDVAVSGYEHMPIFINADTASATFNLIRVLPGAAGQSIAFSYFDAGDAAGNGSVKVLPPTDATGSILITPFPGSCKATGGTAGSGQILTACTAPLSQSSGVSLNNGKTETIVIPIPTDYTCNYNSFGGCWYRVQVSFQPAADGTGSVHDVTTWDATIIGDPVRLIK